VWFSIIVFSVEFDGEKLRGDMIDEVEVVREELVLEY
jgi:hypothetical protein